MKDKLTDFIHRNRSAFDDRKPSEKVWKKIEGSLGLSGNSWWNSVTVWRAAAIIFMALSGYLLLSEESLKAEHATVMKEFSDVESFYIQQISNKVELIDEFKQNEGLNGFTQDFQQLEAMYLVLKEEMKASPSEKVKDALVLNLLVRIDLLNQHLQRLEEKYDTRETSAGKQDRKT